MKGSKSEPHPTTECFRALERVGRRQRVYYTHQKFLS